MWQSYTNGLAITAGLIIALGAQNAFVLAQSLRREHHLPVALLDALFEHRTVVDRHQCVGDVDPEVGIDTDQIGVECRMVQLRQRKAVWNDRMSLFFEVADDVRGIEETWLRQPRNGTSISISLKDRFPESSLV